MYAPYKTGSGTRERVRGVSDHQECLNAFPMARMNRMIILYMHTQCNGSDYDRARANLSLYLLDGGAVGLLCANGNKK